MSSWRWNKLLWVCCIKAIFITSNFPQKRIAELETRLAETCQLLDASAEEKAKLVLEDGAKIAELEELRTK